MAPATTTLTPTPTKAPAARKPRARKAAPPAEAPAAEAPAPAVAGPVGGEHAVAGAPSTVTGKVTVSLGLVAIPVQFYAGTGDGAGIERKTVLPVTDDKGVTTYHPVGRQDIDKVTGEVVTAASCRKAVAVPGGYVEITDDELEQATMREKGVAVVEAIIPLSAIGSIYLVDKVGQYRPQSIGTRQDARPDPAAAVAVTLLTTVLAERGCAALIKVGIRAAARYAALCPDGRVLWLSFADQVRQQLPMPAADLDPRHLDMARQLIDGMGVTTPVLEDTTGREVRALVDAKLAAGQVVAAAAPAAPAEQAGAGVILDLMASLEQSIAAAKATRSA